MPFTIATMSRGDASRLREWVEYHSWLGFDEFHIVLDNPNDDSESELRALEATARITVDVRPPVGEYYDGLSAAERWERVKAWRLEHAESIRKWGVPIVDPLSMRQYLHLPAVLNKYALRRDGWLALIDVDEFLVLPDRQPLTDVVGHAGAPRIRFLNFNFDTAAHDPGQPVLRQHRLRWAREDIEAYGKGWQSRVKTMARYDALLPLQSVHSISPGSFVVLDPEVGRLHHYKAVDQGIPELPYRVEDRTAADCFPGAPPTSPATGSL